MRQRRDYRTMLPEYQVRSNNRIHPLKDFSQIHPYPSTGNNAFFWNDNLLEKIKASPLICLCQNIRILQIYVNGQQYGHRLASFL